MRGKCVTLETLTLFAILIASGWLALAQAQEVRVGVAPEDWFEYDVLSLTGNGTEFSSGVSNFTVTVFLVTGSLVNFQEAICYQNGTAPFITGYTDLSNGSSEGGRSWFVVSANLSAGDPVYPGWNWIINRTVTVDGRPTNYLSVNNAYLNNSGQDAYVTANIYIDQATGAVVNATINSKSLSQNFQFTESYALIEQNVWTVPEFRPIILIATILTLTACTAASCSRKAKSQRLQRKLASSHMNEADLHG